jgi:hypothetical protein
VSRATSFESTVLGGLPVWVEARVHRPEPDVGIFHEQVEIEDICWLSGKTLPPKVQDRIKDDDIERLQYEALDQQ